MTTLIIISIAIVWLIIGIAIPEILVISMIVGSMVGWITHIVISIQTSLWILLLAGALFFPIGIIHGLGYWLGYFH